MAASTTVPTAQMSSAVRVPLEWRTRASSAVMVAMTAEMAIVTAVPTVELSMTAASDMISGGSLQSVSAASRCVLSLSAIRRVEKTPMSSAVRLPPVRRTRGDGRHRGLRHHLMGEFAVFQLRRPLLHVAPGLQARGADLDELRGQVAE